MKRYLDYNATTPLDERVKAAMIESLSALPGNPSSNHQFGRAVRATIDRAREQVAALVGAHSSQVVFTSGGTEANNLAVHAVTARHRPGRLALSVIEHPSLLEPAKALIERGWTVDLIAVDDQCRVTTEALNGVLTDDTVLVSVMMANNETGVIQDVAEFAQRVRAKGKLFHTDAVQAVGKVAVDFAATGVHMMSLSAHKIYGPKGAGALIFDKKLELAPMMLGGGQERGLRAGTENVAAIVGFGVAAELAADGLAGNRAHLRALRERLETGLAKYSRVRVFAQSAERLPNTVQMTIAGIDGETLLMQLDRAGIAVSSGSACASGKTAPSHVLTAMGVDEQSARGAIRVSLGKHTTEHDIEAFLAVIAQQIQWVEKASQAAGW